MIVRSDAPSTFRMPISFVLCTAIKDTSPYNPRQLTKPDWLYKGIKFKLQAYPFYFRRKPDQRNKPDYVGKRQHFYYWPHLDVYFLSRQQFENNGWPQVCVQRVAWRDADDFLWTIYTLYQNGCTLIYQWARYRKECRDQYPVYILLISISRHSILLT